MAYGLAMSRWPLPAFRVLWILAGGFVWMARGEVPEVKETPYQLIVERNPFGLKPIPTNAPPPGPGQPGGAPVKQNLLLSGIGVDSRGKKAYLVSPATPGKTTNTVYYTLREGDSQGDVKVITIDPKQKTVTVVNAGITSQLDFANNAPPVVGALAAVAGAPGQRPGVAGQAGVQPMKSAAVAPRGGTPSAVPLPAGGNPAVARVTATPVQPGTMTGADGGAMAARTIPSRNIRTPNAEPSAGGDAATQWLQWKAQEQLAISQGLPFPPPVPVPDMTQ
jgi:hypothetical protein